MSDNNVIEFPTDDEESYGYTILHAKSLGTLQELIEEHLADGWRPFGAAFVGSMGRGYCQCMQWFKEREEDYE